MEKFIFWEVDWDHFQTEETKLQENGTPCDYGFK